MHFFLGALRVKYFYWSNISPRLYFGENNNKVRGLNASRNMGRIQSESITLVFLGSDSSVGSSLYFIAPIR